MMNDIQGLSPIVVPNSNELNIQINKPGVAEKAFTSVEANSDSSEKASSKSNNKTNDFSGINKKISDSLNNDDLDVQFSLDHDTKKMILRIVNNKTDEVVHQYPPEVSLKIARMVANTLETGQVTNAKI
jgi:uncharacterized FlaG/YvyC family protein